MTNCIVILLGVLSCPLWVEKWRSREEVGIRHVFNNIPGIIFSEHPVLGAGSQQVTGGLGPCVQVGGAGPYNKHWGVGDRKLTWSREGGPGVFTLRPETW